MRRPDIVPRCGLFGRAMQKLRQLPLLHKAGFAQTKQRMMGVWLDFWHSPSRYIRIIRRSRKIQESKQRLAKTVSLRRTGRPDRQRAKTVESQHNIQEHTRWWGMPSKPSQTLRKGGHAALRLIQPASIGSRAIFSCFSALLSTKLSLALNICWFTSQGSRVFANCWPFRLPPCGFAPKAKAQLGLMTPLAWCNMVHSPGWLSSNSRTDDAAGMKARIIEVLSRVNPSEFGSSLCNSTCLLKMFMYFTQLSVFRFDFRCTLTASRKVSIFRQVQEALLSTTTTWLQCGAPSRIYWRHLQSSMQACSARHASELQWEATLDVLFHSVKTQIYRSGEEIVKQGLRFLKNNMSMSQAPASSRHRWSVQVTRVLNSMS